MRPVFTIQAGSRDITEAIQDRLLELSIMDEAGVKSDQLKLTLDDRRREEGSIASLPGMGTVLSVSLGYAETSLRDMGLYVDAELGRIAVLHLDQVSESDMALLTRIAEKHDAVAKPVHGHLVLARAGEAKSVGGANLPQIRLDVSETSSWSYKHSARTPGGKAKGKGGEEKRGGFKARWWDYEAGKDKWVTVGEEPFEELPYRHKTEAEAKAAAAAKMNKGKRKEGGLSLTMPGNTSMAAECRLHIVLRPGLATDWRITKAEHRISNSGYTTQVEAEIFLQQQEKVT